MPNEINIHLGKVALSKQMNCELMPVPGHSSARRTRKEVKAKRLHIRPSPLIEPCGELILILKMASYAGGRPVDVSGNYYVHADGSTVAVWSLPSTGQCVWSPKRTFLLCKRASICNKH